MDKEVTKNILNTLLLIFSIISLIRVSYLIVRVENLYIIFILLLSFSCLYFTLFLKGYKKCSYIFLGLLTVGIILGPEITSTILGRGELGWYDEIDGQIGFALTEGSSGKGFNHFWAGGTPYNHGFKIGNLPLYFSKELNISIYLKILIVKIIYWLLAILPPLIFISNLKRYQKEKRDTIDSYYFIYIFIFIFSVVNILEFHGWIFARGFLGPLIIVYISFIRLEINNNNFYIFSLALIVYLLCSFFVPSFINGALEGIIAISGVYFVDLIELKGFRKGICFKLATISLGLIFFYIIFNQFIVLGELNLDEFSRSTRIDYPSIITILEHCFRNTSTTVSIAIICLLGVVNKNLRLRSFLYLIMPILISSSLSILLLNIDFEFLSYLKLIRPGIILSTFNFFLIDLILIRLSNNSNENILLKS